MHEIIWPHGRKAFSIDEAGFTPPAPLVIDGLV
jgi:hypothetical protein